MSIKLNDTQLVLLSAASQRDDHCLVRPAGPKRAQAQRAVAKLAAPPTPSPGRMRVLDAERREVHSAVREDTKG